MQIIDLTDKYTDQLLENNDFDKYTSNIPELFDHYFTFWANKKHWHQTLSREEVEEKKKLITDRLHYIENKFAEKGFNFDIENLKLILFVGQGTTNGHSFRHQNSFSTFIPIETYSSEKNVDVFITHEIIHTLHYIKNPELFFESLDEKENLKRQLITEGVATYLTKEILDITDEEALWADYLNKDKLDDWISECTKERNNLQREFSENNNSVKESFLANDPKNIRKYRSGYFLGLELIKNIASEQQLDIKEILNINKIDLNILH